MFNSGMKTWLKLFSVFGLRRIFDSQMTGVNAETDSDLYVWSFARDYCRTTDYVP